MKQRVATATVPSSTLIICAPPATVSDLWAIAVHVVPVAFEVSSQHVVSLSMLPSATPNDSHQLIS